MSTLLVVSLIAITGVAGILSLLMAQMRRNALLLERASQAEDRECFSDYYRPMLRLLDSKELLAAQQLEGVAAIDFAEFRRGRLTAFHAYLKDMRNDFNRIEFKIRFMLLSAEVEDADLVIRLNELKAKFQTQLLRVRFQMVLYRIGIRGIAVEVAPLIEALEQIDEALFRRPALASAMGR